MSKLLNIIALVLVAALSCIGTRAYYLNKHQDFIAELNAAYSREKETQLEKERELSASVLTLTEESHARQQAINKLSAERRSLIKRLRDPGNTSSCQHSSTNKDSGNDHETIAGTELSREATEFLLDLTRDADQVAEQLRLCQNFLRKVPQCVQ